MLRKSVNRLYLSLALLFCILATCYFYLSKPQWLRSEGEFKKISDVQHASQADYIFLQDTQGQEWIYKQIADSNPDDQIAIVLEAFAYEIARPVDIPINQVRLIPGNENFAHSFQAHYPGSLHLKVLGKNTDDSPPWKDFDMHQKIRSAFLIAKKGPLPSTDLGLRREIIQNMAKHPDLAKIAALDTYLGNNDRSNPNIFYDQNSNAFYGIDMGNCFMGNLAQSAKEKLEQFRASHSSFSKEEWIGLTQYRKTLQSLISRFPPAKTMALLDSTLKKAGFFPENPLLWNEDVERKVKKWKLDIEENYTSSVSLAALLEEMNGSSY